FRRGLRLPRRPGPANREGPSAPLKPPPPSSPLPRALFPRTLFPRTLPLPRTLPPTKPSRLPGPKVTRTGRTEYLSCPWPAFSQPPPLPRSHPAPRGRREGAAAPRFAGDSEGLELPASLSLGGAGTGARRGAGRVSAKVRRATAALPARVPPTV